MADVQALEMDVVTEKSNHQVVGMAVSPCLTPPAPPPIPYPLVAMVAEGISDSPLRTKVSGTNCATIGSVVKTCHGNEPGVGKEVVSLNQMGPVAPTTGAFTVLIELGAAGITGSLCDMNKAPTPGVGSNAGGAGGAGGGGGGAAGASGGAGGPSGPSGPSGGGGGSGGSSDGAGAGGGGGGGDDGKPKGDLRDEYERKVRDIKPQSEARLKAGESEESVARAAHQQRRDLGEQYKDLTPADKRAQIYARNQQKYETSPGANDGDPLGPSYDYLRNKGKSNADIIESAARPGGQDIVPKLRGQS